MVRSVNITERDEFGGKIIEEKDVGGAIGADVLRRKGASFADILRGGLESAFPEVGARNEAERKRQFDAAQREADRVVSSKAFQALRDRFRAEAAKVATVKKAAADEAFDRKLEIEEKLSNLDPEIAAKLRTEVPGFSQEGVKLSQGQGPELLASQAINVIGGAVSSIGGAFKNTPTGAIDKAVASTAEAIQSGRLGTGAAPSFGGGAIPQPRPNGQELRNSLIQSNVLTEQMERQLGGELKNADFGADTSAKGESWTKIKKAIPGIEGMAAQSPQGKEIIAFALKTIGTPRGEGFWTLEDVIKELKIEFGVE